MLSHLYPNFGASSCPSGKRMASLWQQWPVTDGPDGPDGPDADASETAAADGADDSPGGGCASTAETGASDAATQQPTEAEESPGRGAGGFSCYP